MANFLCSNPPAPGQDCGDQAATEAAPSHTAIDWDQRGIVLKDIGSGSDSMSRAAMGVVTPVFDSEIRRGQVPVLSARLFSALWGSGGIRCLLENLAEFLLVVLGKGRLQNCAGAREVLQAFQYLVARRLAH